MKIRKIPMRERVKIAKIMMRTLDIRNTYTDKEIAQKIKEADKRKYGTKGP